MCPPFTISENAFSALFWPKFQLSRGKISEFLFPRPLIFEGKSFPYTPLLETLVAQIHKKKKKKKRKKKKKEKKLDSPSRGHEG